MSGAMGGRFLLTLALFGLGCEGRGREVDDAFAIPDLGPPVDLGVHIPPAAPELVTVPNAITWAVSVEVGGRWWRALELANRGRERLDLASIGIEGPFRLQLPHESFLADPDDDGQPGIALGGVAPLRIYFEPTEVGPATGEVRIETNDPRGSKRIPLSATGTARPPCTLFDVASLDFGEVPLGVERSRTLKIRNCGDAPIEISALNVGPGYRLPAYRFPARIRAAQADEEPPTWEIEVFSQPRREGPNPSTLEVFQGEASDLLGLTTTGTPNQCPVAAFAPLEVRPAIGVPILLDASPSRDPEGERLRYYWSLVGQPPGSALTLRDTRFSAREEIEQTPTALLVPVVEGRYELTLDVTDRFGRSHSDCAALTRLTVDVGLPQEALVARLRWSTGGDEGATELDLHLSQMSWFDPLDCSPSNRWPDWALDRETANDPGLTVVGSPGSGPELLFVPEASPTPVQLGVHYFREHDPESGVPQGPADAELELYTGGRLLWRGERRLGGVNHFWHALELRWPGPQVREVDALFERRP